MIESIEPYHESEPQPKAVIKRNWDKDISELEKITLPDMPMQLNEYTRITDVKQFLPSHLYTIKANNGNIQYKPYLDRLRQLKEVLQPVRCINPAYLAVKGKKTLKGLNIVPGMNKDEVLQLDITGTQLPF